MMPTNPLSFPEDLKLEKLLDGLRHLSWGAADILRAYARGEQPPHGFQKALDVHDGGEGPVTAADFAVNTWLMDGLMTHFPQVNWQLLSEETAKEQLKEGVPIQADWLWILDPLDGTKDFLEGTGEYAVHLALVRDHSPTLGVVLLPEKEELWFGLIGIGSWCENRFGQRTPVRFSHRKDLKELILVASRNHRDERLESLINSFDLAATRSIGSVGCKVASILRGESDFYISLSGKSAPKDWDMAAPDAVLTAAGGNFTHADGICLEYNTGDILQSGCLIASNGNLHPKLCQKALQEMNIIDPGFLV